MTLRKRVIRRQRSARRTPQQKLPSRRPRVSRRPGPNEIVQPSRRPTRLRVLMRSRADTGRLPGRCSSFSARYPLPQATMMAPPRTSTMRPGSGVDGGLGAGVTPAVAPLLAAAGPPAEAGIPAGGAAPAPDAPPARDTLPAPDAPPARDTPP